MKGEKIASGLISSFEYSSHGFGREILHRLRLVGKVGLAERIALYNRLLENNPSSSMFCILDNSRNFENTLTYTDLGELDELLLDAGIKAFFGATVTYDNSYPLINKLAMRSALMRGLHCELLSTHNIDEAEAFLNSKLAEAPAHAPR